MKIAYFDCFSGISGDMAVGALLDAGVPIDVVSEGLRRLGITDEQLQISIRGISRSEIHATKFDVEVFEQADPALVADDDDDDASSGHVHGHHDSSHKHHHGHSHSHDHAGGSHDHDHGHSHDHAGGSHDHHHGHQRSFSDIVAMIDRSDLSDSVKERSRAIFRSIAIGESRIHNVDVDNVHFHEVGALDSIVDVVATALCLEHLGVEEVYSSVIPVGSGGTIETQHGTMPLPAPATLEILKGYPIRLTKLPFELTTPTGAGIIKALSSGTLGSEQLEIDRVGFGAGTRELPDRPNLLRVIIGQRVEAEQHDVITVIETNIDDLNPQIYPHLLERLFESGASDACLIPVVMKKGRPGMMLSVVAPPGALDELTKVIYRETTTIGVRYREMNRRKLAREEILVPTEYGPVRMKRIGSKSDMRIAPEYEEARRIARERSLPLRQVLHALEDVARAIIRNATVHGDD